MDRSGNWPIHGPSGVATVERDGQAHDTEPIELLTHASCWLPNVLSTPPVTRLVRRPKIFISGPKTSSGVIDAGIGVRASAALAPNLTTLSVARELARSYSGCEAGVPKPDGVSVRPGACPKLAHAGRAPEVNR